MENGLEEWDTEQGDQLQGNNSKRAKKECELNEGEGSSNTVEDGGDNPLK